MSSHSSQKCTAPVAIQVDSLVGILEEGSDPSSDGTPDSGISLTFLSLGQPAKAKSAAMASIFRLFQRTEGADDLYSELAQQLCEALGFPIAAVAFYDRLRAEMVLVGSAGIPGAPASLRTSVHQTLSGKVALSGQILCETRASRRLNYQIELLKQLRLETFVGVPVYLEDEVVAILAVADSRSRVDAEHAVPLLTTVAFALAQDIRRRKLEVILRRSERRNEHLSDLSARMESLHQEERVHLAREIHDGLGQILTAIKINLHRMEHDLDLFEADPRVNRLIDRLVDATELADSSLQTVRELATTLRPGILDKLGFAMALQSETARFEKRTGIACSLHLPPEEHRLDPAMITGMFRIVQEALTNVARHARATQVEVLLESEPDSCRLTIRDNGRGLVRANPEWQKSLGLLGMQERAHLLGGCVDFSSPPGGGTSIIVTIPLPSAGKNTG